MQLQHTFPSSWDHNWIINKSGQINSYNIAQGLTQTVLSYTGTQAQFDSIQSIVDDYEDIYLEEVLKPTKIEALTQTREVKIKSGVSTPFGEVYSDEGTRTNIVGATVAALIASTTSQPFSITWTMKDNSEVSLTATQMITLGMSVLSHVNSCYENARLIRNAINASTTISEISEIDLTDGWP